MTFPSLRPPHFQIVSAALVIFSLLSGVHPLGVDTPHPISECETEKLTWHGDHSPFTLHILFSQNNSLVQEFANVSANSVVWKATVPAGTMLYLEVFDSNTADDSPSYSGNFAILHGDDSCLQSSSNSSSTDTTTATTPSYTSTGGSQSTSSSETMQPSDAGAANPPERKPANTLSTGAIAGIAVACLAAGLLIALGIWLIRRRRTSSRTHSSRIPDRQQFDSYNYPNSPKSDDGWSVTTPRDPDDELRSQPPGQDKTDPSWDPSLFVREKTTPSPSLSTDHPAVTRQAIHPGVAITRPLSSYPPLIPTPSPIPMSARESGMWANSSSGASLSRSSTNPFRARMLAAAGGSGTAYAPGVNGSNW